ncbi:MAG TPA: hypothetical protein VIJ93_04390, partial [bacterium]
MDRYPMGRYLNLWNLFLGITLTFFLFCPVPIKAQVNPAVPRGTSGDLWADKILGQTDYANITPNQATPSRVFQPGGVVMDNTGLPNHNQMYVYDSGNNRVMVFNNLSTLFVTVGGVVSTTQGADLILGQSNFVSTGCNRDSNWQNYVNGIPPVPNQFCLCGLSYTSQSPLEAGSIGNMAVDPHTGDLYVPDYYNNRVLRY